MYDSIPQIPSYAQISISEIFFMNSLRGKLIHRQSQEKSTQRASSHTLPSINSIDEVIRSKSIFYACTKCEGALVPISTCTFCKRTSLRTCTKCHTIIDTQFHESCKILISFANIISSKITDESRLS